MTFAIAVIIAVYLPILFLQDSRRTHVPPHGHTVCAALFGSLVLALTLIRTLVSLSFSHWHARKSRA
jgi:Cu/Ag efflux pump CusA